MTNNRNRGASASAREISSLRDHESQIRAIVDTVVDGIITIDQIGTIETFNPAAERIFGYALNEVVGQNVKMLMPAPYQGAHDGYLQSYMTSGEAKVIGIGREVTGLRKDGSTFPMELIINEMKVGGKRKFTGIVRDISERKQTEGTLSDIMTAVQNSQLVTEFEMDGTIITANDLFCDALGYQLEEILGKHHSLFLSTEDAESADYKNFWNALKRGEFQAAEFRRIGKGGKEVWLQATYTPILDSNGKPLKVVKFATDISDTVIYRNRIKDSEARTLAIVDTVVDGIVTIDARGTIETFNPAAATLFGYAREEVLEQNIKMLMPEPYHSEHDGYLLNYQVSGEAKVIGIGREVTGRRKDGSTFPMELAVSRMEVSGVQMFTGIVRDITDRKEAERAKSEFVSTVSHELRTPLTSIKGSLGLIRSGAIGELPEKMRAMLDIAYNNSDRLVLLINDILDMEKISAGKMDFIMAPTDVVSLIDEAVEANQGYGDEYGVTFVKVASDIAALVQGDKGRLMQVLANLMSNAAKFSPDGERVELSITRNENLIRIAVKDKGPGVPEDFKKTIFQKFSQADSSDTRKKGGTGLGLSITKAIVEQHGGTVGFETETGKGSTFFFELPELVKPAAINEALLQKTDDDGLFRILHIEDDESILQVVSALLADFADIVYARSLVDANRLLEQEPFDLVIMDLILPDGDGETLLPKLDNPAGKSVPVIIFSAKDVSRKTGDSIKAVLVKSRTTNDVLLDTIRSTLEAGSKR